MAGGKKCRLKAGRPEDLKTILVGCLLFAVSVYSSKPDNIPIFVSVPENNEKSPDHNLLLASQRRSRSPAMVEIC
jgi:hypothetical protein